MFNEILCAVVFLSLAGLSIYQSYKESKLLKELEMLKLKHLEEIEEAKKLSVKKSKDVTRGHISEEFVPLFPDFPYDMSDCRFLSAPLDYIVYKGMSDVRNGVENAFIEIIFADVKVNTSQKSKVQNAIKKAIEEGRVKWETWKVDENKKLIIKYSN